MHKHLSLVVSAAVALLTTACFADNRAEVAPAASAGPRVVYVAIGASDSVGVGADNPLREAWPRVLFRQAFSKDAVLYDLARSGSTLEEAIAEQLPEALELEPTVVTVWLNVNDITSLQPPGSYERSLQRLVHALRRDGKTQVYVADTPPAEHLPAVARIKIPPAIVAAAVELFNAAIERVCAAEGAVVVSLHAAGEAALANGTFDSLIASDGFHPSTAGHAAIARAFADAIKAHG
jgi:acyl-CoA thioesterase-1